MSNLENIEKLVEEYKPRIEAIFGMEIGNVEVKEYSHSQLLQDYADISEENGIPVNWFKKFKLKIKIKIENKYAVMVCLGNKIYVNLKLLNKAKGLLPPEIEEKNIVHELAHILDVNHNLSGIVQDIEIKECIREGFAEYVASEFPEIYQDEKVTERIKQKYAMESWIFKTAEKMGGPKMEDWQDPYQKGYKFFKRVTDKIGRKNILKVFQNPPQSMEEILQPELYLERIEERE